jgi:hypothetical protein
MSLLPVRGNETFVLMDFHPDERKSLQLQVRCKRRSDAQLIVDEYDRPVRAIGERSQVNYRGTLEWYSSAVFRWRSRFEYSKVDYSIAGPPARGIMFYQDFRCKPLSRLSIDGRAIIFETDSYDSRIYEYESELRGTFVNPALYGKGIRLYVLGRYSWSGFEISAKYACTTKPGSRTLSSGPAEIQGDTDNQLSLQIDVSL